MRKVVSGHCPTQNKSYSVSVSYIDAQTMSDLRPVLVKGIGRCDYVARGGQCNFVASCPIIAEAPQEIRL